MGKLITIVGPTASGKSALAMELAKKYSGEIICADSRTIYKGMDIGTAKPSKKDQEQVPHYLLDVAEPNQRFSAAEFKQQTQEAIKSVQDKGKVPFLVGGSGMYIDTVLFDYSFRESNSQLDLSDVPMQQLLELAKERYPNELANLDVKNRRRVEQFIELGPSNTADRSELKIDTLIIGICPKKALLKQNIEDRTKHILSTGFVQEVRVLAKRYGKDAVGLQSTGYKRVLEYLNGELDRGKLEEMIVQDTLKLSKKQITWFKRNPDVHWVKSADEADELVMRYLQA